MNDCDHKKVSMVYDGDVKIVCPICDDVDFNTVGDHMEIEDK